ncbi:hypothetical protein R50076_23900 [Gilvimarinus japonicus]
MNIRHWTQQLVFIVLPFICLSAIFPIISWTALIYLFHGVEVLTGYHAPLVGDAEGYDLGAVLATLMYVAISFILVVRLYKRVLGFSMYSIAILSTLLSFYVFSAVSTIIWF